MSLKLWSTAISKLYLWATSISKAYLWSVEVFSSVVSNWLLNWLVSYYKFDTSWSFPDAYGSNTWTINWATYTASWKNNWAYSFDWINDYIQINNTILPNTRNDYTISFWIKTSCSLCDLLNDRFGIRDPEYYAYKYRIIIISWKINFWMSTWPLNDLSPATATSINDNVFHHICVKYTIGKMEVYIDWVREVNFTSNNRYSTYSHPTQLWRIIWASTENYYTWIMDELCFYNVWLTEAKILGIYNSWAWKFYDSFTA